tara:strand:+ start:3054 stop:5207 length:2154 start_codon:yes stop_codon:yes gene_type:complete
MAQVIYEFELPNGDILEIEGEEGKQAEATAKARQYINAQQPTLTELGKDVARSVVAGGTKGLSYLAGFPGDIGEIAKTYAPSVFDTSIREMVDTARGVTGKEYGPTPDFLPTSKEILEFDAYKNIAEKYPELAPDIEARYGDRIRPSEIAGYEPQTTPGRYAKTMTEFAFPSVLAKTPAARKFATKLGAGSGALFQGLEDVTGSTGVASAITIPATFAMSFFGGPSKAAEMAQRAMQAVSEEDIVKGLALEKQATEMGIKLLPGEVIQDKQLASLVEKVIASDAGSPYIYGSTKGRDKVVRELAEYQASKISSIPESQREVMDLVQTTSKQSIKDVKRQRSIQARDAGYSVANTEALEPNQVLTVIDQIDNAINSFPKGNPNIIKLNQIKRQLIAKTKTVNKQKVIIPETNINKLDLTFKQFRDDYNRSKKGVATEQRFIDDSLGLQLFNGEKTGILDILNTNLRTNKSYASANDEFARLSETLVDPVVRNIKALTKNDITLEKIKRFVFNPAQANPQDIKKTLSILNKTDPEATVQIANTYFRNAMNRAFAITKQGEDASIGFKLAKDVMGTKGQRANFLAVLDGVAEAKGIDAKSLKIGFENFLNVLERTGNLSNINKPGFNITKEAQRTLAKDIAMAKTFNPLVRLSTKYGEIQAGGAFSSLGKIFAKDNALEDLILMAKTDPKSKIAISRALQIINATQQMTPEQQVEAPALQ